MDHRKDAIYNLGSLEAQELCFVEYQMVEELAELYLTQRRYVDLFRLHLQQGNLEKALSVPFNNEMVVDIPEQRILDVIDHVAAKHLLENLNSRTGGIGLAMPEVLKTIAIRERLRQWNIRLTKCRAPPTEGKLLDPMPLELQHINIKQFIHLQVS